MEVGTNASMWCWLPQGCLKVEALQELLSWGLPTPAMLGSCHSPSTFVATCNLHCPKQGQRTPREAARDPSTWAHTTQAVGITRESCQGAMTRVPKAATSHSRSYRSTECLEFMESSRCVGIGRVFSRGMNVLPWTCHGVEQVGARSLRMGLASAMGMLMGTWAKCFKIKCMLVSCMGRAVPLGNGQCFECRGLVSKLTFLVPEKEERAAEERECSWRICIS